MLNCQHDNFRPMLESPFDASLFDLFLKTEQVPSACVYKKKVDSFVCKNIRS